MANQLCQGLKLCNAPLNFIFLSANDDHKRFNQEIKHYSACMDLERARDPVSVNSRP